MLLVSLPSNAWYIEYQENKVPAKSTKTNRAVAVYLVYYCPRYTAVTKWNMENVVCVCVKSDLLAADAVPHNHQGWSFTSPAIPIAALVVAPRGGNVKPRVTSHPLKHTRETRKERIFSVRSCRFGGAAGAWYEDVLYPL